MTDAEKTAVLVDRLFGGTWPHVYVVFGMCSACSQDVAENPPCSGFDPFSRIEDAFAVVERLKVQYRRPYITLSLDGVQWYFYLRVQLKPRDKRDFEAQHRADTPQRAISEAAYLAVTAE